MLQVEHIYIIKNPIEIFKGLAFEQVLYYNLIQDQHTIFQNAESILCVWRSKPAVVIGRNQNIFSECNFPFLFEQKIDFARRDSGGGTVFQDERNLNFCFIRKQSGNIEKNLESVREMLSNLGKPCTIDEKHNIRFQGDKVSGSAFRYRQKIEFHHFTLLLNSNLDILRKSIHPEHGLQIRDKSIQSQRSSVTNLEIDIEKIYAQLNLICEKKNIQRLDEIDMLQFDSQIFENEFNRLRSDQWRFGKSPEFEIIFTLSELFSNDDDILLRIRQGKIVSLSQNGKNIWEGNIPLYGLDSLSHLWHKNDCCSIIKKVLTAVQKKIFGG